MKPTYIFVLVKEDLTGLVYTIWTKNFTSQEKAKAVAEQDYKRPLKWQSNGRNRIYVDCVGVGYGITKEQVL